MSLAVAPVTDEQVRQWDEDDCTIVRGLFSPSEMAAARAESDRLMTRTDLMDTRNIRCRWQPNVVTGESCQFEFFDPIIDLSPMCASLAYDDRLLAVLSERYREPACLFKDKLIFKPPGVKGYGLHQDWIAWPRFPRSFLTVLIPFDRAGVDNGATEVFPGYHHAGRNACFTRGRSKR
jgi:2-aminoethylphosphonate dioxygenase